jgi:hypothetical protein
MTEKHAWNTAQLNYLNPEMREAMIQPYSCGAKISRNPF